MQQTSATPYRMISLFSVLILIVITWGFYRTYLVFFPSFKGFSMIHHFHGAMMMIWMTMLIVQPLLIRAGRLALHRSIGRLSFIIAPLVVLSIFLTAKLGYLRPEPQLSSAEKIAGIALPIPGMISFAIFYGLAIFNRQNTHNHLRYMIGTAILMIGPGLGRAMIVYFNIPFPVSVTAILILAVLITLALLIVDASKGKNYVAWSVMTVVNLLSLLTWQFRMHEPWQTIGSWFAAIF